MLNIRHPLTRESGFSLVELLVAMAVASILMAAIASSYWIQTQTSREQQMVVEMQQNQRSAAYILERDIMMAGYDDDNTDAVTPTVTIAGLDVNGNPELEFSYIAEDDGVDNDGDGNTDEANELETIHYRLFDSAADDDELLDDLQRRAGDPPIAENIDEIEFFYTLADGTRVITPANQNARDNIRMIGVSLLARTSAETRARETATYTAISGVNWGPFNDGFMRQLVTFTIMCRNM